MRENGALRRLIIQSDAKRGRLSSYDVTGGNNDYVVIEAGKSHELGCIDGAGLITHIWMTMDAAEKHFLRKLVLKVFWDDEPHPSVEVPIGDFFGAGHCRTSNFVSLPIQMSPENGRGFNCWFPMPFARRARFEVENQCQAASSRLYYYIDYELWPHLPEQVIYFHAQWRRSLCRGKSEEDVVRELLPEDYALTRAYRSPELVNRAFLFGGKNITGKGNYIILDAKGSGHFVGTLLYIHNLRETEQLNWYGEGDDMIFIDGEEWPPSLHGTGTEDYFNMAWCPTQQDCAPYHGLILSGGPNWSGKITLYRFHIEDPVYFSRSIRVTIEHGHNNHRWDDISSVAFWYQTEPHVPFPPLPPVLKRLPLGD